MKCKHAFSLFDSYIKQTASKEDVALLEEHIATCDSCKKQLELYRLYLSDVRIEDDFLVPSQLNAKLKYTIHQAKQAKTTKIPFWQNKRILSAATACAFLFVASILGVSNYEKLQNAAKAPVSVEAPVTAAEEPVAASEVVVNEEVSAPVPTPGITKNDENIRKTPEEPVVNEAISNEPTAASVHSDNLDEPAAYSVEAAQDDTLSEESSQPFKLQRTIDVAEDITLSADQKDSILESFPHEVISEDVFLVTITKAELESILNFTIEVDESKPQLIIKFTTTEN